MEYKALDQVLRTTNLTTNQPEAITYRCADFDRIVPQLMGVSKVPPPPQNHPPLPLLPPPTPPAYTPRPPRPPPPFPGSPTVSTHLWLIV